MVGFPLIGRSQGRGSSVIMAGPDVSHGVALLAWPGLASLLFLGLELELTEAQKAPPG